MAFFAASDHINCSFLIVFWLFIRQIKLCDFLNIYITSAVSKRLGGWGWSRGNVELMNLIYFHVFIDRTVWPVWSGEMTVCCCSESGLACSRCGKSSPGRLPAIGCDWVKIQTGPSQSADLRFPFLLWASSAPIYQNPPEIKGRPRRWWVFWEYKCLLPYNYFFSCHKAEFKTEKILIKCSKVLALICRHQTIIVLL